MEININHTIDLSENAQKFLTALLGGNFKASVDVGAGKAAQTGNKKKDAPATNDTPAADGTVITFDMLKGRFAEKKAEGKNDGLKKLLADNNVGALSGLKEVQYAFFYEAAGKL